MKKVLIFGILVLFLGSLLALESSPSEVVGFVKYSCVTSTPTSNNFIAYSMDMGFVNASELGDAIGVCNTISWWDNAGQGWQQISKLPVIGWSGDFALQDGYPYMIGVTGTVDYYVAGSLGANPTFNLITSTPTSNNALMLRLDRSDLTTAPDLGDEIGVCNTVSWWDNVGQGWQQISKLPVIGWSGTFNIEIGDPLMVGVTSNVTWPSTDGDNSIPKKLWEPTINEDNSYFKKPMKSKSTVNEDNSKKTSKIRK